MNFIEKRQLMPVLTEGRNKYDSETQFRIPKCSNEAAKTCWCPFFWNDHKEFPCQQSSSNLQWRHIDKQWRLISTHSRNKSRGNWRSMFGEAMLKSGNQTTWNIYFTCIFFNTLSTIISDMDYKKLRMLIDKTFSPCALQPNAGHGLLIHEVSRSHTATHHSR